MIEAKEVLMGKVNANAKEMLTGVVNIGTRGGFDKYVSNARLENKLLYLDFNDGTTISVDLSSLSGGTTTPTELTQEEINAINSMIASMNENLILEYDDTLLDVEFKIENNNLVVTNNENGLDFSINKNGEMEAIY